MKLIIFFSLFPFLIFSQVQIGSDINGEASGDRIGDSVSLSSDGSIIAIGSAFVNEQAGQVQVYENQSGVWIQLGSDISDQPPGEASGTSISLSSDGNLVAIGTPFNTEDSGSVQVYEFQSNNWIQVGSDIIGESGDSNSGSSVSLSSNGTIIAIGAPGNEGFNNNNPGAGHVRVYEFQSNDWVQIGGDINGEGLFYYSGSSVSLSSDGTIIAIGALGNNEVRIYEFQSNNWVQIGNPLIGENVSLSSNGTIVATGSGGNSGYVKVYKNLSGTWTQIGNDINGEAFGDQFGTSISLSSNGTIVAIGATENDGNGENSGHVKIYRNLAGTWTQIGNDINGEASEDQFGTSISLSSNGNIVIGSARFNDGNGENSGHVRVFDLSQVLNFSSLSLSQFSLYPNPAQNQVTIQLQEGLELNEATIYNTLGQFISTSKDKIINTSHLSSGMYLLEIETNQGKATKQFIVE